MQIRIFLFQILGILALVAGYFLSDQPDSLSFMSFNPNPACPNVITKAEKMNTVNTVTKASVSTQNNPTSNSKEPKYIPLAYTVPEKSDHQFSPNSQLEHTSKLPKIYDYLFYKEINPPPPKSC